MVMGEEIVATLWKTTSGTEVQVSHMSLKKCTVVPLNTIKYVMEKCAWDITGDVIPQPSIKHPELLIPQTVVALEDQQTPVKLCNLTHKFVTLKKGCNLGHLEEVDGILHEHATVDMEANCSILQCSIDTEDKISEEVESSSKVPTLAEVAELVPNHIKDLFLHCLLAPAITAFIHTLPPGRKDPFWVQPGKIQHGKLLWKAHQFVITVVTYLKHYLEQPYMVVGVPHVYFGLNIHVTDLPDIVAFLIEYQYPPEMEWPEEDDNFIVDFSVACGDVTAICGVAPTEESLLVDASAQLEVNDIRDDPFEELEIMVAEGNLEVTDAVDSQEESSCRSNRSHAPPTCCICFMKPSFGLQRHACYTYLPWFVQYSLASWVC